MIFLNKESRQKKKIRVAGWLLKALQQIVFVDGELADKGERAPSLIQASPYFSMVADKRERVLFAYL